MTNRIRYIRPDFFLDDGAAALPADVQLFLIGLGTHADRSGRLEDRPKKLKAQIKPFDPEFDPEEALTLLALNKRADGLPFIVRYEADGERFIQICGWEEEQRPHPSERPSEIPPPPDNNRADVKEQPHNNRADDTKRLRVDGDGDCDGDGDRDGDGDGDRGRGKRDAPPAPSRGSVSSEASDPPAPLSQEREGKKTAEASSRPKIEISETTIREFLKTKTKEEVIELLKNGNYPIPEFLFEGGKA